MKVTEVCSSFFYLEQFLSLMRRKGNCHIAITYAHGCQLFFPPSALEAALNQVSDSDKFALDSVKPSGRILPIALVVKDFFI